jgi:hypothetical protein
LTRIASLLLLLASAAAAADMQRLVATVRDAADTDRMMRRMRAIYERDRWFTFPKFQETIDYLAEDLRVNGIATVEKLGAPADGKTNVGFWIMPMAWDVTDAQLEVIAPERLMLANYKAVPASLGMWSGATPPGGVEAELVEWADSAEIRGKLVLTPKNSAGLKWQLARRGALGAVNTFTENPKFENDRQWINAWGDNGWAFTKNDTPLLSFSITPKQAAAVRTMLAQGKVRVRAQVNARFYDGLYPYLTALLPGTSREEVLALAHTAEQGANDNATGVAAMVEALVLLRELVESGKLPRPARGIRILAMPEIYGSMHYITAHRERIRNTVAAICLDTPAGPEYDIHLNPGMAKSYVDDLALRLAALAFKRPWKAAAFRPGTDTFLADPMIGVPTVWPYAPARPETHHNSADTPDTVDPASLTELATYTAAFLYYIAAPPPSEAARIVITRKRPGPIPLDELAPDKREGFPSGAWARVPMLALFWCDGKRTLAEVIRLTEAEAGPTKFDYVGYFRFLAKHGYVDIAESK